MGMRRLLVLAAALAVVGCLPGPPGTPVVASPSTSEGPASPPPSPSASPSTPPSSSPIAEPEPLDPALAFLRYTCDGHPFALGLLALPGQAELEAHPSADALRAFLASGEAADLVPIGGWYLAGRDERTASYVAAMAGDPPFAEVQLALGDGGWQVVGYGQCRPMLALEGQNPVMFEFADDRPGPGDRQVEVLATELSCAGGRPTGARLRPARIIETPAAVYVLLTAATQPGGHDCPGNPSTRVTLVLTAPLGNRPVLDVAVFPFHDPAEPWPPG